MLKSLDQSFVVLSHLQFAEIPADLNNIDNEAPNLANHLNVAEPEDGQIEVFVITSPAIMEARNW